MEKANNTNSGFFKAKIIFYVSTVLLTLVMAFSVGNYFFNNAFIRAAFIKLGYPTYIIYPLAVAKILGVIAIWGRRYPSITDLAYAGFFYNFILAFFAHIMIHDNAQWIAVAAFVFLIPSYLSSKQLSNRRLIAK